MMSSKVYQKECYDPQFDMTGFSEDKALISAACNVSKMTIDFCSLCHSAQSEVFGLSSVNSSHIMTRTKRRTHQKHWASKNL